MNKRRDDIEFLDESGSSAALRRIKNNPFLAIGMTGFLVTAAVGAYKYKSRPKGMSTGLFLVQLRVAAQTAVIGTLTVGMAWGMFQEYVLKKKPET
ncbi:hypothetical protein HCN44_001941 [Aphidius gifuensis]|uniref:HIG1 domain-containing protein n=1 Tax=Aphidius gifuensis TaxID=684658 RepID=A0A834Y3A7_APHGI|nr:HIG1 domain family member 1A, mitochondrial-like [Aphidius gifuensis]KAF7996309.1 hypothetical protein HCN44_001941 [Aphidius gifuensis]